MRLQLAAASVLGLVATTAAAHADGTLAMRGVYYKERSTRVMQPMLDGMFEVGSRGLLNAHLLVDAITSASAGSGAANATPFTERRYEAGASYAHELDGPADSILDRVRLGGDGRFSTESDYRSIYAGVRAEADLAQKNATVGLGGGVSADKVDNSGAQSPMGGPLLACHNEAIGNTTSCDLDTYSGFASVSQIVSPNAVIGATYDIAKLSGFQANPYRQVITSAGYVAERHPLDRLRQSFAVSARYFVTDTSTTVVGAYRYYTDDWHVHAHTPELRIIQEVGRTVDASVRYRYYTQTAAYFYEKRYGDPMMTEFLTDDPKMSDFDGHLMEAKLGMLGETFDLSGHWAGARFEGILEYIVQHNRFGNAVVAHVSLTLPFDY